MTWFIFEVAAFFFIFHLGISSLHLHVEWLCFININLTPLNTFSSAGGEVKGGVFEILNMQKNSRSCHQRRSRAFDIVWDVIFSPIHVIYLSFWVIRVAFLLNSTEFCRAVRKFFHFLFFLYDFAEKPDHSKRVKELETSIINTTQIWETTITSYELMEPLIGKKKVEISWKTKFFTIIHQFRWLCAPHSLRRRITHTTCDLSRSFAAS